MEVTGFYVKFENSKCKLIGFGVHEFSCVTNSKSKFIEIGNHGFSCKVWLNPNW